MQTFTQFALPATILASAVGAVVLCVILFFYGFRSEEDAEPSPARRLFVMRLGHAIAAACFAAALMLGSVALIEQRRAPAPAASAVIAPPTEDMRRLEAQVTSLEERLAATELRLGDAVQQLSAVQSRVAPARPASRPAKRTTRPARRPSPTSIAGEGMASPVTQRELGEATTARPAASTPMTVSTNTSASEDLGARVRGGWQAVTKGFRKVGDDVRSGFTALGRRLKNTFD